MLLDADDEKPKLREFCYFQKLNSLVSQQMTSVSSAYPSNMGTYDYTRFILVGNGFDLSLGMKTSFSDFYRWYLRKHLQECHSEGKSANPIFGLVPKEETFQSQPIDYEELDLQQLLTARKSNFYLNASTFDERISEAAVKGWVDLEALYFEHLMQIFNSDKSSISQLNRQLHHLGEELENYLSGLNYKHSAESHELFLNKMRTPFRRGDFGQVHGVTIPQAHKVQRTIFVNFNYTSFLSQVIAPLRLEFNSVHIHGKLNDSDNPIILGYGDDMNDMYKQLELESGNDFLEHIKSFRYLHSGVYKRLLTVMDHSPYEVFVVGHSCGLSDRTFLTTIFEHDNCRCVKIFHRGDKEEHRQKAMNISRHFTDKFKMRNRVLPFDKDAVIPQIIQ